jgi:tripeptide aminopeptidase
LHIATAYSRLTGFCQGEGILLINEIRLVEDFLELVKIDASPGNERAVADRVKEKLTELGLTVEEDQAGKAIQGNCGNLIASLTGDMGSIPLFFAAHMDRVKPGDGIEPAISGRMIHSTGDTVLGADDIVAVAAMLEAVRVIKEDGLGHGPLEFIFTVAEEMGLRGSRQLDISDIRADGGFILDGDGPVGTITHQGPTKYTFNAKVRGRAAHAAINPAQGVSAILVAAEAVAHMRLGQIDAATTANIGTIHGGTAVNIVPENVEITGEARSLDAAKAEAQLQHMREAIEAAAEKYGAIAEINAEKSYEGFAISRDDPLVKLAEQAACAGGIEPRLKTSVGGSDANIFNANGKKALNMGVAFQQIHSSKEHILIDDMVLLARYILLIISTASKHSPSGMAGS